MHGVARGAARKCAETHGKDGNAPRHATPTVQLRVPYTDSFGSLSPLLAIDFTYSGLIRMFLHAFYTVHVPCILHLVLVPAPCRLHPSPCVSGPGRMHYALFVLGVVWSVARSVLRRAVVRCAEGSVGGPSSAPALTWGPRRSLGLEAERSEAARSEAEVGRVLDRLFIGR